MQNRIVYELVSPGSWIEGLPREQARPIETTLDMILEAFYEANAALWMFNDETWLFEDAGEISPESAQEQWKADMNRRRELFESLGDPSHLSAEERAQRDFEIELLMKKEKWAQGHLPDQILKKYAFLHARSFLYALDAVDKHMKVLRGLDGAPQAIGPLHDEIAQHFPDLREVRNSAQHTEDRVRGLGKAVKNVAQPLKLKPVHNGMFEAPNGILVIGTLWGTRYGNTMADGHYGEVDVSAATMTTLQSILQRVINAFQWRGHKQLHPRY